MAHSEKPDAYIVEQVMRGDGEAFAVLVERYLPVARAVALAQTCNPDDADDVAQEALLKAYTSLGGLRDRKRFGAWLATIARNLALSLLRRKERHADFARTTRPDSALEPDIVQRELYARVRGYVDDLPPTLRETVLLHYFAGRTLREIAELCGTTLNAAAKRLTRARETLGTRILDELMTEEEKETRSGEIQKLMGLVAVAPPPWRAVEAASASALPAMTVLGGLIVSKKILVGGAICVVLALALWGGLNGVKEDEEPVIEPQEVASVGAISEEVAPPKPEAVIEPVVRETEPEATPPPKEEVAIPEGMFRVGGKVVNTAGQAVPGASLILYHGTKSSGLDDRIEETTQSDLSGEFLFQALVGFDKDLNHPYAQDTFIIVATHDAYALAWHNVRPAADHSRYRITMTQPTTRTLMVVDKAGKPIDGALVWPYSFGSPESSDSNFRDHFSVDGHAPFASQLSDAQGEARFENLPETNIFFRASKLGYARGLASRGDTIVLTAGATLSGRVATNSGQPVAGARVALKATSMREMTRSDDEGRYAFVDVPARGYDVLLRSDEYTTDRLRVGLSPGDVIKDYDIVAYAGTLIRCSVVTSDTGEPLVGARVHGSSASGLLNGFTDRNGLIEFRVLRGEASLSVLSPPEGIYLIREVLTLDDDMDDETRVEFLAEGPELEITLVSPPIGGDLVPVFGELTWPAFSDPGEIVVGASTGLGIEVSGLGGAYTAQTGVSEDGTFEFRGAPEGVMLHLHALSADNRFGGVGSFFIEGDGDNPRPFRLVLEPAYEVDVDLTYEDGQPIVNASVTVVPIVNDMGIWRSSQETWIDETGQITVKGALRGVAYRIGTRHIDPESRPRFYVQIVVLVP